MYDRLIGFTGRSILPILTTRRNCGIVNPNLDCGRVLQFRRSCKSSLQHPFKYDEKLLPYRNVYLAMKSHGDRHRFEKNMLIKSQFWRGLYKT